MNRPKVGLASGLVTLFIWTAVPGKAWAQVGRRGGGSTVQGDVLRGEGAFLQGAGWYELNSAKGRGIDQQTEERIANWNAKYYEYQKHLWNTYQARKKDQSQQAYEAQVARAKETAYRLRNHPGPDDVIKGDALNALLLDLSDPRFTETEWRISKVPLPEGMSIGGLVFRFAPKAGAKGSESLSRGVIALSRLDVKEWPIVLRDRKLEGDRKSYETAYLKVRDECVADKLSLETVLGVNRSIQSLKAKVSSVVPTDLGYRTAAARFVDQLGEATQMFQADTVEYASEIVKDTQEHDATTVGELLAFMRKYRLIFSSAQAVPGGEATYGQLYGALRKQKEALGIKDEPAPQQPPPVVSTEDLVVKVVAARAYVDALDFRGNADRRPHKVEASNALKNAEAALKANRSTKEALSEARKHLQALVEVGVVKANAERVKSATKIIDELLKMAR